MGAIRVPVILLLVSLAWAASPVLSVAAPKSTGSGSAGEMSPCDFCDACQKGPRPCGPGTHCDMQCNVACSDCLIRGRTTIGPPSTPVKPGGAAPSVPKSK